MATTRRRERPTPYTPAGDLGSVLGDLEEAATGTAPREGDRDADGAVGGDDEGAILPKLDTALEELAATVDDPVAADDSGSPSPGETGGAARDDGADEFLRLTEESGLARERADFEDVAESTDVDAVPFDDAATFLANDLYTVPPANTRFRWVDADDLLPAS